MNAFERTAPKAQADNLCYAMLKWASLGMIVICDHLRSKSFANERVAHERLDLMCALFT